MDSERRRITVTNPATGEIVGKLLAADETTVARAVAEARNAFPFWSGLSFADRAEWIRLLRRTLLEHKESILDALIAETGKVRAEAMIELLSISEAIQYYLKHGEEFIREQSVSFHLLKNKRGLMRYVPYGVVGVIGPWNFPLDLTISVAIPALLAGNTVVIKPSEVTPWALSVFEKLLSAADFPRNVFSVLPGYGDAGAALIDHVDKVTFTGSVETGKKVMKRAAERLVPVTLELGGKDPMVVLADANLERAANAAVWGAFCNSGQLCMSVERVYVERPIARRFIDLVVSKTRALRQGVSSGFDNDIGSMTFSGQLAIVEHQIADALAKGATVRVGGERHPGKESMFFRPTILTEVDHSMAVMQEETFGPVMPIMVVKNEAEAVRLANDTRYGLNASVWSSNRERALSVARRIRSGQVCVNELMVSYLAMELPFGGMKQSGIGRRHGPEGIRKYTQPQGLLVNLLNLDREILWYPYSQAVPRALTRLLDVFYGSGLWSTVKGLLKGR